PAGLPGRPAPSGWTRAPGSRWSRPGRCLMTWTRWAMPAGTWRSGPGPGGGGGGASWPARPPDAPGRGPVAAGAAAVGAGAAPALPLDELIRLYEADQQATAAELDLTLLSPDVRLRPGGRGEIAVKLSNATASQIRGEAQLLSPFGSWAAARPWTRGFTAGPSAGVTLAFTLAAPATARPGQHWWALVKVMYFGRVRYSEPAAVTVINP